MKLLILSELLLEGKLDDLERKFGPRIQDVLDKSILNMQKPIWSSPRLLIDNLFNISHHSNAITSWLVRMCLKGCFDISYNGIQYVNKALKEYFQNKHVFTGIDITTFDSIDKIFNIIDNSELSGTKKDRQLNKHLFDTKQIVLEEETDRGKLYSIHTEEAMQFFGRGTKWCVSATNKCAFNSYYDPKFAIYVWVDKLERTKYCMDFLSHNFMDVTNFEGDHEVYTYCKTHLKVVKQQLQKTKEFEQEVKNCMSKNDFERLFQQYNDDKYFFKTLDNLFIYRISRFKKDYTFFPCFACFVQNHLYINTPELDKRKKYIFNFKIPEDMQQQYAKEIQIISNWANI